MQKLKKILSLFITLVLIMQNILPGPLSNFEIKKAEASTAVTVLGPNGGENLIIGDSTLITFRIEIIPDGEGEEPDYTKLYYSEDLGHSWIWIDDVAWVGDGDHSYPWEIPIVEGPGENDFLIKADVYYIETGLNSTDRSDAAFDIDYGAVNNIVITTPTEVAHNLEYSISVTVYDAYNNPIANFEESLDLVTDLEVGLTPATIGNGSTTGNWENGSVTHYGYTATYDPYPADFITYTSYGGILSNQPTTTLVSDGVYIDTPTASTEWDADTTQGIVFRAGGRAGVHHLKIEYSDNNGGSWNTIQSALAPTSMPQTYNWYIPTSLHNYGQQVFQIKITSYNSEATATTESFLINFEGSSPPNPEADIEEPISKVVGILSNSTLIIPMPSPVYTSKFTIVAEATDNEEVAEVELYWSRSAISEYEKRGSGEKTIINGDPYWQWDFDTNNNNGWYYFYTIATDTSLNIESLPKPDWPITQSYDAKTNVSSKQAKIRLTNPVDKAEDIATNTTIRIVFNDYMDPQSVEDAFSVVKQGESTSDLEWTASWRNLNRTVIFSLATGYELKYETIYEAFVDPNIATNQYGEPLNLESLVPNPWTFTTVEEQFPNLTTSTKIANLDFVPAGGKITYTITLTNTDSRTANVSFRDIIPTNTIYDNYIRNATYNPDTNAIEWYGTLGQNRTRTIRFRVKVDSPLSNGTIITNTAVFNDGFNNNIERIAQTIVESPEADITLTSPIHNETGISITPKIRVVFSLAMDQASVEKAFSLSRDGKVVEGLMWETAWSTNSRRVDFTLVDGYMLEYLTQYSAYINPNVALTMNGAPLSTVTTVPNPWTFTTTEQKLPDLSASFKESDQDIAAPGSKLLYTITIDNSGTANANVVFNDKIPGYTTYDNYVRGGATYNEGTDSIEWSGIINAGSIRTIRFRVVTDWPLPNGTEILNEAVIEDGINEPIVKTAITIMESTEANLMSTAPIDGEEQVSNKPTIKAVFDQRMDRALTEQAFSVKAINSNVPEKKDWIENWDYRKKITIDHTQVSGNQSNFPVLITATYPDWKDIWNGGHVNQTDGGDILFTKADGITQIDHEIESYNPTTGELTAWVELDAISSAVDTEIYIYYGNEDGVNYWNSAGVWNSAYKTVQHMSDTTSTTISDSTSNNFRGTKKAVNDPVEITGKIGKGQSFDRSAYINLGNYDILKPENITIEGWAKADELLNWMGVLSNMNSWGTGFSMQLGSTQNIAAMVSGAYLRTPWSPSIDTWYHIVATHDADTNLNILYVNGEKAVSFTRPVTYNPGNDTQIGVFYTRDSLGFDGIIDEIRISDVVRSPEWIKTEYNNQNYPANFFTIGNEESATNPDGLVWNATWSSQDKVASFILMDGYVLDYATEYEVFIDSEIAKTRLGAPLNPTSPVSNPWTFVTAGEQEPNLTASSKTADQDISIPGEKLLYTIRMRNTGNGPAQVTLTDAIPTNTTYAYYTLGGATYNEGTDSIEWSGTINAGRSKTIRFQVTIGNNVPNGTEILNEAIINDGIHEPFSKFATTVIESNTNWDTSYKITTNDNPDRIEHTALPGDILTNTIFVENTGTTDALNTLVSDLIPRNTTYVENSITGGLTYNEATNSLEWLGDIGVGLSQLFTFKVTVNEDNDFGGSNDKVINEAVISDSTDNFSVTSSTTIVLDGGTPTKNPPYLINVNPDIGERSVKLYSPIIVSFSESVRTDSLSYIAYIGSTPVDTSKWRVSSLNDILSSVITIYPDRLESGAEYMIQITDAIDAQGQHLATDGPIENNEWTFSTVRPAFYFTDQRLLTLVAGEISGAITVKLGDWVNYDDPEATAPIYEDYKVENNNGMYVELHHTSRNGAFDSTPGGAFDGSFNKIFMPKNSDTINFYYTDPDITFPDLYKIVTYAPYEETGYLVYAGFRPVTTTDQDNGTNNNQIYFTTGTQNIPVDTLSDAIGFEIRSSDGSAITMKQGDSFLLSTNSTTGMFFNQSMLPLDQYITYRTDNGIKSYYKLYIPEDTQQTTFYYKDSIPSTYLINVEEESNISISGLGIASINDPINGAHQIINILPIKTLPADEDELQAVNDETDREISYIVIDPTDTTVLPNGIRIFKATGYDTEGFEIENLIFSWHVIAGGGTISSNGLTGNNHSTSFTAGVTPGVYTDTVMVATLYNGEIKAATATIRVADVIDYGGPGTLPPTGPDGIQWLFIILILISAVALAEVEHYEKTHFKKKTSH